LGWNKSSTFNLKIKYGKATLGLIVQAALYQLRQKLDTIIVTFYNLPEQLNLKKHYENLPEILANENVNPKIPWLFNFKLDFKFK